MKLNHDEILKKFDEWAGLFNVPAPRVEFKHADGISVCPGMKVQGQYDPHLNYIMLFGSGMNEEVAKHEFIHYVRRQMGLNKDMKMLHQMGISREHLTELHDFEEGRTYWLTPLSWEKIIAELKTEKEAKESGNTTYKPAVDEHAMDNEKTARMMAMMASVFTGFGRG